MKKSEKISLAGLSLFIVLIVRAFLNDWEYDEAWTYNGIYSNSIIDLFLYSKFKIGNHHLLNSLYFKLLQSFSISHVFFYRLISLLSFLTFFYANINILKSLKVNKYFILFIVIAPYLVYFTLGRGYGFGLATFSCSLMYLIKYKDEQSLLQGYSFVIFGILSTLSIFSFLYGFAAMILLYLYYNRSKLLSYHTIIQMTIVLLTFLYVYYAGKIITSSDPNIIGSESILKNGTISSIVADFTGCVYLQGFEFYKILKIIFVFLLSLPFIFITIKKDSRKLFLKSSSGLILIIVLTILLLIISNSLFHSKYPYGRSVIYLHYIIVIVIAVSTRFYLKRIYYLPLIILLAFSIFINIQQYRTLSKPSIKEILESTKESPLFITGHNPNIKLINQLYRIKEDSQIYQSSQITTINNLIKNTNIKCFLLTTPNLVKSINYNINNYQLCRKGLILIELDRTPTHNNL